jgi:transposase
MFAWYWLADLCAEQHIPFVLGHTLYMKAIHQGKSKNDRLDAAKIAGLLRGGLLPQAYVYPKAMRATRDLLRRRSFLVRRRAELLTHLVNTNSQYNLPALNKKLVYPANRGELDLPSRFTETSAKKLVECDLALIDALDVQIHELERHLIKTAKVDDVQAYARLQSVPGIGKILGLVLLYEIHDIASPPPATSCRTPGWCGHSTTRRASPAASATRRSATPTSAGPSAKRPACTYAAATGPNAGKRG